MFKFSMPSRVTYSCPVLTVDEPFTSDVKSSSSSSFLTIKHVQGISFSIHVLLFVF